MPATYRIADDFFLDVGKEELRFGEKIIDLSTKSWQLFEALVEKSGEVLKNREMLDILDPETIHQDVTTVDRRIIDALKPIRKVFRDYHISAEIRHTKSGYRLDPPPILIEKELRDAIKEEAENSSLVDTLRTENVSLNIIDNMKFRELVKSLDNNIHLATKRELEHPVRFPLTHKLNGIDHMTLLNFAGTSFLQSKYIASVYQGNDQYSKWFFDQLINGGLEADVILTNPSSYAAKDAAIYKMYPRGLSFDVRKDEIIQLNINLLLNFQKNHPNARVNLYLTDICLPYGIMLGESYSDPTRDFMKIDLYSPLTHNDDNRPSFYLLAENKSSGSIYSLFKEVITHILSDDGSKKRYTGKDTDWLLKKPIIHRGRIRNDLPEHSIHGYWECIKAGLPMEIDILLLKDGTPVVGRDVKLIPKSKNTRTDESFLLSDRTIDQLRGLSTDDYQDAYGRALQFQIEEIMTLTELLDLVNGRVGLLIEIKADANTPKDLIQMKVKSILDVLRYYSGNYAIHSANPNVLEEIRPHNMMVPLGLISWSFSGTDVPDWYKKIHASLSFDDIGQPDFISYKFNEIVGNLALKSLCQGHRLPLLAWTVGSTEDEAIARDAACFCDNIIIEGASSFL